VPTAEVDVAGVDPAASLRLLDVLGGDPTLRRRPDGLVRATQTPEGPGSITVDWGRGRGVATVHTDGPGGSWLLARAPGLLGCLDDPSGFAPDDQPLRDLWRRHRELRLPRTATLWHDLAWWIVQQRIATADAADQWRRLVRTFGEAAPGAPSLLVPPDAATVAGLGYHDLHPLGIERRRADHLIAAARAVPALESLVDAPPTEALHRLARIRGVGPWTATSTVLTVWGDPDVVVVGDHGLPRMVAWTLAGERRADDARMLELLEPYRPHRARVVQLVLTAGRMPPRRTPRWAAHDIRRH
jgi:3-methyladenine DNA glycosylase/8-oxoguanine DNA glycosylase